MIVAKEVSVAKKPQKVYSSVLVKAVNGFDQVSDRHLFSITLCNLHGRINTHVFGLSRF